MTIRLFFHAGTDNGPGFEDVAKALCHRRASVIQDEALCINSVLGLDNVAMVSVEAEDRTRLL